MKAIRIKDRKLRLMGIPLLALVIAVCFNLFYTLEFGIPFWKVFLSNLVYAAAAVELTRLLVLYINRIFPDAQRLTKTILLLIASLTVVSPLLGSAHVLFEKRILFRSNEPQSFYDYLSASGSTLFFTLIVAAVYQAWYFFMAWSRAAQEKEAFEKASLQAQYELLKSQVQPHFLFNSLNSLISLVDEDTLRAKKFIKELSFVYRYLLQSNMHNLVTLEEELTFLSAYQFLLQTRFEEGLTIIKDIHPAALQQLLPPLTLQVLLENAVKHNSVEKAHPLMFYISATQEQLMVQNNVQRKPEPIYSTKLGLSNIMAKYASLHLQQQVRIEEKNNCFFVVLPLIDAESSKTLIGKPQKSQA